VFHGLFFNGEPGDITAGKREPGQGADILAFVYKSLGADPGPVYDKDQRDLPFRFGQLFPLLKTF
jgi:hypothetical protein